MRTLFDRAAERGNRSVEFFGAQLTLPPEARFGSVDAVRRYVDQVLTMPAVTARWPAAGAVAVRARRGVTAAHYEFGEGGAVIAVPERQSTWALRELVVFFGHFAPVYVLNVLTIASPLPLNGVAGASRLSPARATSCAMAGNREEASRRIQLVRGIRNPNSGLTKIFLGGSDPAMPRSTRPRIVRRPAPRRQCDSSAWWRGDGAGKHERPRR